MEILSYLHMTPLERLMIYDADAFGLACESEKIKGMGEKFWHEEIRF